MFYSYILYSKSTDSFYKGSTQDIQERLRRHNGKFEKATQFGAPWILLWYIGKSTRGEPQILEYKLKNLSRKRTCDFMIQNTIHLLKNIIPQKNAALSVRRSVT